MCYVGSFAQILFILVILVIEHLNKSVVTIPVLLIAALSFYPRGYSAANQELHSLVGIPTRQLIPFLRISSEECLIFFNGIAIPELSKIPRSFKRQKGNFFLQITVGI